MIIKSLYKPLDEVITAICQPAVGLAVEWKTTSRKEIVFGWQLDIGVQSEYHSLYSPQSPTSLFVARCIFEAGNRGLNGGIETVPYCLFRRQDHFICQSILQEFFIWARKVLNTSLVYKKMIKWITEMI